MFRTAALLLFASAVAVAAPVPKALKKRNPADGVWEAVEWVNRGERVDPTTFTLRWTVEREKLTIERTNNGVARPPRNSPAYTLVTADKDNPKAVDYTVTYNGGDRVRTYRGLMEVDGDTLKFCYEATGGGTRPTECKGGESVIYYEFKRVKPEDK